MFSTTPDLQLQRPPAEEIQDLFNRIAPIYDQLNQQLSLGLHHVWKGMTVRWARPPVGGRVLDLCCGSGDLALQLARRVGSQGQVWGVDFSERLLTIAKQRSDSLMPHHQFQWLVGDALNLPFTDHSFDAITMGYGLRNLTQRSKALEEMYRVLKPGAWAGILDFAKPEDQIVAAFQAWYLQTVVVPTASRYGLANEYAYIAPSLDHFLTGQEQLDLARATGFKQCQYFPLLFGLMGVLVVQHSI